MKTKRKGIILAGGTGTRLWPLSIFTSKHLLPIYDKPLIYYPLTTLMLAEIDDILIVTTDQFKHNFVSLLGDGKQWGVNINYKIQKSPKGIVDALIISEDFIGDNQIALILGDNIFYGSGLSKQLNNLSKSDAKASVFAYNVLNPNEYGVCKFNNNNEICDIIEKPKNYISNWVIPGIYFYNSGFLDYAKKTYVSMRNELEITSLNNLFLKENSLYVHKLDRGFAWLDAGSPESLLEASHFVRLIEKRQGLKIGCPEEIAFRNKLINSNQLKKLINVIKNKDYASYLKTLIS